MIGDLTSNRLTWKLNPSSQPKVGKFSIVGIGGNLATSFKFVAEVDQG